MTLVKKLIGGTAALAIAGAPIAWNQIDKYGDSQIISKVEQELSNPEDINHMILQEIYLKAHEETLSGLEEGLEKTKGLLPSIYLNRSSIAQKTRNAISGIAGRLFGNESSQTSEEYASVEDRIRLAKLWAELYLAKEFYGKNAKENFRIQISYIPESLSENIGTLDYLLRTEEQIRGRVIEEIKKTANVRVFYKKNMMVSFEIGEGNSPRNIYFGIGKEKIAEEIESGVSRIINQASLTLESYNSFMKKTLDQLRELHKSHKAIRFGGRK